MAICPTGVGILLYPWQHLDRTGGEIAIPKKYTYVFL